MDVLRTVLATPSRYDERGVVGFLFGMSPNGALGALAGLAEDYNRRHAGRVRIDYELFDEHVEHPITSDVLRRWRDESPGARFVLMICGVQTSTYPRARDIALVARREGIDVIAGGVHLSAHGPSVDFLVSCGVRVAIGEVEPIWDEIIDDAVRGRLQPIYRVRAEQGIRVKTAASYMTAPDITDVPFPHVPRASRRHYVTPSHLFIDGSRGCPYLCTFCVVKNVFGRTVRSRDPEKLVSWMMERVKNDGVRAFTFSDDNFVRNPRHIELLERLAAARSQGYRFSLWLILDVESACYAAEDSARGKQTRHFLQLCKTAGVAYVYMGLESTNDAVLQEMRKGVNRDREEIHGKLGGDQSTARHRLIRRYRAAVDAWHGINASVECGYILGFHADERGVGLEAVRDLIEIGVDIPTFYLLAPLPGSEDYARAQRDGALIESDFNEYFRHRAMVSHPTLSRAELETELSTAVAAIWSWPNVIRRIAGGVLGLGRKRANAPFIYFKKQLACKMMVSAGIITYVGGGLLRRRDRVPREAISDEEARRVYLGNDASEQLSGLPSILRDDSSMESLPVLSRNASGDSTTLVNGMDQLVAAS